MLDVSHGQTRIPDLSAPIVPGRRAAGIEVGGEIADVLAQSQPSQTEKRANYIVHEFGAVKIWSLDGVINQIGVYDGYHGMLDDRIGVGSTIAEVEAWCGCQVVEDDEDNLVASGRPGWSFETEQWTHDHAVASNRGVRINAIFVFQPKSQ
jgi:hypothetical protein